MKKAIFEFMNIQERMRFAIMLNCARLNKLQILFNKAVKAYEKQCFENKKLKKEQLTSIVAQLYNIDNNLRDYLLKKYLIRCKLYHSLAFFRWRYANGEYENEEERQKNREVLKEIFDCKVDFLKAHLEKSIAYRKSIT